MQNKCPLHLHDKVAENSRKSRVISRKEALEQFIDAKHAYFCSVNDFSSEISFKTARSGGSGGQNVNKVETMAEALWHVANSRFFTDEEKELVQTKLATKINKEGYLHVKSSATRSQLENKLIAQTKLEELVAKSLIKPKKRKPTKPSKEAKEKRLESKKKESLKKEMRKPLKDL